MCGNQQFGPKVDSFPIVLISNCPGCVFHCPLGDLDVQLYEIDPETGELREIEGGGPFWNDDGRFVGVDWLWRDENGKIFAYTDREYFLYHFPGMLENYINTVKRG